MSRLHVVRAMISAAAAMFWMWPCSAPSVNDTDQSSIPQRERAEVDQEVLGRRARVDRVVAVVAARLGHRRVGAAVEGERHDGVEARALRELVLVLRVAPEHPEGARRHGLARFRAFARRRVVEVEFVRGREAAEAVLRARQVAALADAALVAAVDVGVVRPPRRLRRALLVLAALVELHDLRVPGESRLVLVLAVCSL